MQCPNCGQVNRQGAKFCARCRAPLSGGYVPLQTGQTMRGGAYRIIRPLTKGGMGAIYLATDTQAFNRPCVIKEMLDYFDLSDPQEVAKARQRFEDEARTLAALSHPGIPKIYTYFSENNRNYIVMEYVEGEDLEQGLTREDEQGNLVRGGPQPLEEVLRYAIQVCKVLEYLGRVKPQPVVHHDIKPANLILDRNSGEVRLVDFGTARARLMLQPGGQVGLQKSSIYGTVGYAPPEQYQAQSEPRSDVYALAATMYHLLTDDDPQTHPFQFLQLSKLPKEVWAALDKASQQDVHQRCTAAQFRQALERILAPKGTAQPFVFRSGDMARTVAELVPLCDRHWAEARGYLYNGNFTSWFRSLNRHDLAAQAEAIRQRGGDQDAGLEELLHILDPQLPQPVLSVSPKALDFGTMRSGQKKQKQFTVQNAGRGYVRAEMQTQQPWLAAQPDEARLRAGEAQPVKVTVDAGRLPTRARSTGGIVVASALGA
ncbi:MAG: protein kinase, partial [Anaerolineae bacterium]